MPAAIQRLAGHPVIRISVTEPFNPLKELPQAEQRFRELASTIEGIVCRVIDISQWNIKFSDIACVRADMQK